MKTKQAKVHKIKKVQTKVHRIKELLEQGKSVVEIVRSTGASAAYVYAVKSKVKRAKEMSASNPVSKSENRIITASSSSFLSRVFNALAFWR